MECVCLPSLQLLCKLVIYKQNVMCCWYFELFQIQFMIENRNNKSVIDSFAFYLSPVVSMFRKVSANLRSPRGVSNSN